jgi:hypothetical protein|tara:strand:- start:6709 stop:7200 length:492 start_codon:yes stop_codon:yes gene_type:complete
MVSEIKLEFPKFITHIPVSKNKAIKIGYNQLYASPHYTVRSALVSAMHGYIENNIPDNLNIKSPLETHLIIYAPINYGDVKRLRDKNTGKYKINWKPPRDDYSPRWDLGNLAMVWLKCLDDVLIKKGIIDEDTVEFLKKTTYEYVEVATLDERRLVYHLKTIK